MFTSFVSLLLLVATVNANLNLSHHRLKRLGHPSRTLMRRQLSGPVNGILGGVNQAANGVLPPPPSIINVSSGSQSSPSPSSDVLPSASAIINPVSQSSPSPSSATTDSSSFNSIGSTLPTASANSHTAPPPTQSSSIPVSVPTQSGSTSSGGSGVDGPPTVSQQGPPPSTAPASSSSAPDSSPTSASSSSHADGGHFLPTISLSLLQGTSTDAASSSSVSNSADPSQTNGGVFSPGLPISISNFPLGTSGSVTQPGFSVDPTSPLSSPTSDPQSPAQSAPPSDRHPQIVTSSSPDPPASPSSSNGQPTSSSGGFLPLSPLPPAISIPFTSQLLPAPSQSAPSDASSILVSIPLVGSNPASPTSPSQTGGDSGSQSAPSSSASSSGNPIFSLPSVSLTIPPVSLSSTDPSSPTSASQSESGGGSQFSPSSSVSSIIGSFLPPSSGAASSIPASASGPLSSQGVSSGVTSGAPPPSSTPGGTAFGPTAVSSSAASSNGTGSVLSVFGSSIFTTASSSLPTNLSTVSSLGVDSQFSFITESSLVVAPTTSTTLKDTLTNPDAVPSTTFVPVPTGATATASPTAPSIPPSLPTRIFSPDSVNPSTDAAALQDMAAISLLFMENLNWQFINQSTQTVGQLFAYMPMLLTNSLSLTASKVKTYALQVEIPAGWTGDLHALGTSYIAYIPQNQVNTLSSMMRASHSAFYNQKGIMGELASLIVPSSLLSVSPGGSSTAASGPTSSSSQSSKTTDAIIGVCTTVGGIAALVGIWWLVRYMQRKQAGKHRRMSNMSDPNVSNGVYGTQHDDRRTSFFYAEDELRGGYTEPTESVPFPIEGSVMQQRLRSPMLHTPISAPVLQQNSLNW